MPVVTTLARRHAGCILAHTRQFIHGEQMEIKIKLLAVTQATIINARIQQETIRGQNPVESAIRKWRCRKRCVNIATVFVCSASSLVRGERSSCQICVASEFIQVPMLQ